MKMIMVIAIFGLLYTGLSIQELDRAEKHRTQVDASVFASGLMSMYASVSCELNAAPVENVAVTWDDISDTCRFSRTSIPSGVEAHAGTDRFYIYAATPPRRTQNHLERALKQSMTVGIKQGASLRVGSGSLINYSVPSHIPDGSLVIVGMFM